jgi:hypothetical protein
LLLLFIRVCVRQTHHVCVLCVCECVCYVCLCVCAREKLI